MCANAPRLSATVSDLHGDIPVVDAELAKLATNWLPPVTDLVHGGAPTALAHQGDARAYPYGRPVLNQRVRFSTRGLPGPPPRRFFLDFTHRKEQCPVVANSAS